MIKKLQSLILCFLICMSCVFGSGYTSEVFTSHASHAETEAERNEASSQKDGGGELSDYSFYKISSAAAAYMSNALSPDGDGLATDWTDGRHGGSTLGFVDKDTTKGISGWLMSMVSKSSCAYSYKSLDPSILKTNGRNVGRGLMAYVKYGTLLNELGFDQVGAITSNLMRTVVGYTLLAMYYLAVTVDSVFAIVGKVLSAVNPFAILDPLSRYLSTYSSGKAESTTTRLASFLFKTYKHIADFGLYVVAPLFIAFIIMTYLFYGSRKGNPRFVKFLKMFVIIILGIPLCGSMYTATLKQLDKKLVNGQVGANSVIASTLLDFEGWFTTNRLHLGGIRLGIDSEGAPTSQTSLMTRSYAMKINSMANPSLRNIAAIRGDWNANDVKNTKNNNILASNKDTTDMLYRFASNQVYTSASWETSVKAALTSRLTSDAAKKSIKEDLSNASDAGNYAGKDSEAKVTAEKNILFRNNGGGIFFGSTVNTSGSSNSGFNTGVSAPMNVITAYNYLSTSFDTLNMTVYSNEQSTSEFSRKAHYSVNVVGRGFVQLLYVLAAISTLGAFAFLGYFYAIGILIGCIKNGLKLIFSAPGAMVFSPRSIASMVAAFAAMIIEIIATIFMYIIVQDFIINIPQIMRAPFMQEAQRNHLTATIVPGATFLSTNAATAGLLILEIIINLMLTFMAIRYRKVFIKGIEDSMSSIVAKFLQTRPPSVAGPIGMEDIKDPVNNAKNLASNMGAGVSGLGSGIENAREKLTNTIDKFAGDDEQEDKPKEPKDTLGNTTGGGNNKAGADGTGNGSGVDTSNNEVDSENIKEEAAELYNNGSLKDVTSRKGANNKEQDGSKKGSGLSSVTNGSETDKVTANTKKKAKDLSSYDFEDDDYVDYTETSDNTSNANKTNKTNKAKSNLKDATYDSRHDGDNKDKDTDDYVSNTKQKKRVTDIELEDETLYNNTKSGQNGLKDAVHGNMTDDQSMTDKAIRQRNVDVDDFDNVSSKYKANSNISPMMDDKYKDQNLTDTRLNVRNVDEQNIDKLTSSSVTGDRSFGSNSAGGEISAEELLAMKKKKRLELLEEVSRNSNLGSTSPNIANMANGGQSYTTSVNANGKKIVNESMDTSFNSSNRTSGSGGLKAGVVSGNNTNTRSSVVGKNVVDNVSENVSNNVSKGNIGNYVKSGTPQGGSSSQHSINKSTNNVDNMVENVVRGVNAGIASGSVNNNFKGSTNTGGRRSTNRTTNTVDNVENTVVRGVNAGVTSNNQSNRPQSMNGGTSRRSVIKSTNTIDNVEETVLRNSQTGAKSNTGGKQSNNMNMRSNTYSNRVNRHTQTNTDEYVSNNKSIGSTVNKNNSAKTPSSKGSVTSSVNKSKVVNTNVVENSSNTRVTGLGDNGPKSGFMNKTTSQNTHNKSKSKHVDDHVVEGVSSRYVNTQNVDVMNNSSRPRMVDNTNRSNRHNTRSSGNKGTKVIKKK